MVWLSQTKEKHMRGRYIALGYTEDPGDEPYRYIKEPHRLSILGEVDINDKGVISGYLDINAVHRFTVYGQYAPGSIDMSRVAYENRGSHIVRWRTHCNRRMTLTPSSIGFRGQITLLDNSGRPAMRPIDLSEERVVPYQPWPLMLVFDPAA